MPSRNSAPQVNSPFMASETMVPASAQSCSLLKKPLIDAANDCAAYFQSKPATAVRSIDSGLAMPSAASFPRLSQSNSLKKVFTVLENEVPA